jgi:hypothetical protein
MLKNPFDRTSLELEVKRDDLASTSVGGLHLQMGRTSALNSFLMI